MFFDENSILSSDEYVVKKFTVSLRYRILMFLLQSSFLILIILATIGMDKNITIAATVFSALFLIFYIFIYFIYIPISILYIITNEKIVIKEGFFDNDAKSIEFERVTDTHSYQSFLDRLIFKSGFLEINTAGSDSFEQKLENIHNPNEISLIIQDLKSKNALQKN